VNPLDLALIDGVGDAIERIADDSVAPLYAGRLQRFNQHVGHPFAHNRTSELIALPPSDRTREEAAPRTRPNASEHILDI